MFINYVEWGVTLVDGMLGVGTTKKLLSIPNLSSEKE